jgi:hypothetical protein
MMSQNKKYNNWIIFTIALFIGIYTNEKINIYNQYNIIKDFITIFIITRVSYSAMLWIYIYIKNHSKKYKLKNTRE